ncbi:MAG: CoB--CoM heterodisulfide reductase iron-sulfur subunit B family protein [Deltaproteobacteria bacterium]|nr:CoB--CoM heterodisulfide reductase iron-sulfur subunit B family protein [Deltaproteobacteria bacterium]
MPLRYAYYPGCASHAITKEADLSTREVCKSLGMELHDMPKANCCGAGIMTDYDKELSLALNARIFTEAEEMGMDILTICSTCLMVMSAANHELAKKTGTFKRTNILLERAGIRTYKGSIRIKQLLWALIEDIGLDGLKKKVIRPLKGLRIAAFYGCHSLRPSYALGFDDPARPASLDGLLAALGADIVEYKGKTKCCGFQIDLVAEDTALGMTAKRLIEAKEMGADLMVTPCPFCHINLDSYQAMAEREVSAKIGLPVLHLAQVVGLALGIDIKGLGLTRNMVSVESVLERLY